MTKRSKIEIITDIYEAFGRGDIDHIMDEMSDTVVLEHWDLPTSAQTEGVPWLLERSGKKAVAEFFTIVATFDFSRFEPTSILEGGDQVAAVIAAEWTHPEGAKVADEEIHLWTLSPEGQVIGLRHHVDTRQHLAAAGLDTLVAD